MGKSRQASRSARVGDGDGMEMGMEMGMVMEMV